MTSINSRSNIHNFGSNLNIRNKNEVQRSTKLEIIPKKTGKMSIKRKNSVPFKENELYLFFSHNCLLSMEECICTETAVCPC